MSAPKNPFIVAAENLYQMGIFCTPVKADTKKPILLDWNKLRLAPEDFPRYFTNGKLMLGALLSRAAVFLTDADIDDLAALRCIREKMIPGQPASDWVSGHQSKPRSHFFYSTTADFTTIEYFDDIDKDANEKRGEKRKHMLLELRGRDEQTLVYPSLHPSGEPITWNTFIALENLAKSNLAELEGYYRMVAVATLLARHYPEHGEGHHLAHALSGWLAANGWTCEQIIPVVVAAARLAGDPAGQVSGKYAGERKRNVQSTFRAIAAGKPVTGRHTLEEVIGKNGPAVCRKIAVWLALTKTYLPTAKAKARSQSAREPGDETEEPKGKSKSSSWGVAEPIGNVVPPVEAFNPEFLPPSFRPFIDDVSERMGVPDDMPACVAAVALAGCVNRRAFMQPKRRDYSWKAILNLWGAMVAPPGAMKSPVLNQVLAALYKIEHRWSGEYEEAMRAYARELRMQELEQEAWSTAFKAAIKAGKLRPQQPEQNVVEPHCKRLVFTDATFEKLHVMLSENPAGVLMVRDELTGWLQQLDKPGREGERAFMLQGWNGEGSYIVDRVGRGRIEVPHVCVSSIGAIQPSRLRPYLQDVVEGGAAADGLLQRMQVLVWPDLSPDYDFVDVEPNEAAVLLIEKVFNRLVELDAENPIRLIFSFEAQPAFNSWLTKLEKRIRPGGALANDLPAFVEHISKYRSLVPKLAALFELADLAASSANIEQDAEVSIDHLHQAIHFSEYLESHARRLYSGVVSPNRYAAASIAARIKSGDIQNGFTARTIYEKDWSGLTDPDIVRSGLKVLEEKNWVRPLPENPTGRPTTAYEINPILP